MPGKERNQGIWSKWAQESLKKAITAVQGSLMFRQKAWILPGYILQIKQVSNGTENKTHF